MGTARARTSRLLPRPTERISMDFDLFICHATEDKEDVVRPLAGHMTNLGYSVWFDETSVAVGESLRTAVDTGLSRSRYGAVVLSEHFFEKAWTAYELDGLLDKEMSEGTTVILPIWHGVTHDQVAQYSPSLATRLAVVSTLPIPDICGRLCEAMGPPLAAAPDSGPVATVTQHVAAEAAELDPGVAAFVQDPCPRCGQEVDFFGYDGSDGDSFDWIECSHCGLFQGLS
jgi:hypothetical protein